MSHSSLIWKKYWGKPILQNDLHSLRLKTKTQNLQENLSKNKLHCEKAMAWAQGSSLLKLIDSCYCLALFYYNQPDMYIVRAYVFPRRFCYDHP